MLYYTSIFSLFCNGLTWISEWKGYNCYSERITRLQGDGGVDDGVRRRSREVSEKLRNIRSFCLILRLFISQTHHLLQ